MSGRTATAQPGAADGVRRRALPLPAGVWWVSPAGAALLVLPATLAAAWAIGDATYRAEWGTPKALTGTTTTLLWVGVLLLVTGSALPLARAGRAGLPAVGRWPYLGPRVRSRLAGASTVLFVVTGTGYALYLGAGLARGGDPVRLAVTVLSGGAVEPLQAAFVPVAGVTTLTQVGIAATVTSALLLVAGDPGPHRRRLVVLLLLAGVRALLLSERLALLELAVPLLAVLALRASTRGALRAATRSAPLVVVPVLAVVFAAFEHLRSWRFYEGTTSQPFGEWAGLRLAGYYVTAYNNGEIALQDATFPGRLPYATLEGLWSAPGVQQLGLYERLSGGDAQRVYATALAQHGNPEFNNPGGLVAPFLDLGVVGGALLLLAVGLVLGHLYRAATRGGSGGSGGTVGLVGLLLYPPLLTGVLELPRYFYLAQGRLLTGLVALGLTAWWCTREGRPTPRPCRPTPRPGASRSS